MLAPRQAHATIRDNILYIDGKAQSISTTSSSLTEWNEDMHAKSSISPLPRTDLTPFRPNHPIGGMGNGSGFHPTCALDQTHMLSDSPAIRHGVWGMNG